MPALAQRSDEIEIMDNLDCDGEVVHQTLRELEVINSWLGGNAVTLNALDKFLKDQSKSERYSIADLGCGSGDMLRLISHFGKKNGYQFDLTGIDANPNIVAFARARNDDMPEIQFDTMNIFSPEFETKKYDIVLGTLFFHHFSTEELISFFSSLRGHVRKALIINDIHRHAFAFHSIKILTRIFSKSAMVKYDAPLSVRRAFRKHEIEYILDSAGYKTYQIRWKWAFRWQVIVPMQ